MDKKMNVFQYAANCEVVFEQFLQSVGKERKTTFFSDLSIAEFYGAAAVMDTYRNVMKSWKTDINYMCEWVIALNQKIWQHYENNPELGKLYDSLWRKADEYCCEYFKGEELSQYYEYTD
jgi:hypothetical protein